MKINNTGCALCNSTWGNYYKKIDNTNFFFCCDVCSSIFEDIIKELKILYEIESITDLNLEGSSRERTYKIIANNREYKGKITFSHGKIMDIKDQTQF